ncbi:MAG TPA: bifunctional UDP-4-keto-pentose/UDP-xylose synthase [Steroidobacteraceae bacterium]|nr:bifunctional UDP-4-keto-pentose/UDP-xylose synthase [Steroidobacteraceae bacterium]
MKRILILGVNGFIGHHLTRQLLARTDWHVYGMDLQSDRVDTFRDDPRFHFVEGDITINREWVEYNVRKCDVVLPLVAIATPATYVREPLKVFELDFEANLPIIRHCVKYRTRVIFPSTSEVYGMCLDTRFDPYESQLVLGPINKSRWIYSCAKQLLDRIIWSYGMQGELDFTLIRPFNWIGSGLDSINTPKEGSSRVLTQFLGNIVRGENIQLVDGGAQMRSFTYIDDAIECLLKIIANPERVACGKIYNIGNPANNCSIRRLAEMMLEIATVLPEYATSARNVRIVDVSSASYYGEGYQDIQTRVPLIENTCNELQWQPTTDMRTALRAIFDAYAGDLQKARELTATGTTGLFGSLSERAELGSPRTVG